MKKENILNIILIIVIVYIIINMLKEKFVVDLYKVEPDNSKLKDFKPNPKKVTKLKTLCDETFEKCIKW
jgi:flagellar biosynthesis protein FlhB